MNSSYSLLMLLLWSTQLLFSQIDYTAHDTIQAYSGVFRQGVNIGYFPPWTDKQLADIGAGNPSINVDGAGVRAVRPLLPEYFLEAWGYPIRVNTFQHYSNLGMPDNAAIIGYPSNAHRDPQQYCPGKQSLLFKNMYLPIWDWGANGTPVNDNNFYALYLYKMVTLYKDHVKFWEVWNEPDQDYGGGGWLPPDWPGNWWVNDPGPCEYGLQAPIYHYIRMLRISYEVIKYVDPDAYVSIGGLGYPSFLDAILRNTDQPFDGHVTGQYPLTGGAYFDVLSMHSYPHLDGTMRYWDNSIMDFVYTRHSDAAAIGISRLKNKFEEVLFDRGYDGIDFPKKLLIITEGGIPRKSFPNINYIGTAEMQRNFTLKALVECQKHDILQYDLFTMSDKDNEWSADQWVEVMGLYKWLNNTPPYQQVKHELAIAYKTYSDLLFNNYVDTAATNLLQMPPGTAGTAFRNIGDGKLTYVLWSKTHTDGSEHSTYVYWIPEEVGLSEEIEIRYWDYSETEYFDVIPSPFVKLTSSPIFVTDADDGNFNPNPIVENDSDLQLKTFPNPFSDGMTIQFDLPETTEASLEIWDMKGRLVQTLYKTQLLQNGRHELEYHGSLLSEGIYLLRLATSQQVALQKLVKSPGGMPILE